MSVARVRVAAAGGPAHLKKLAEAIADDDIVRHNEVRELGRMYLEQIEGLNARVAELDAKMRCPSKKADLMCRAQTMPGVGSVTALAKTDCHGQCTASRPEEMDARPSLTNTDTHTCFACVAGQWMNRGLWVMLTEQEDHRNPVAAMA